MDLPTGATVVRIWTNEVSPADAAHYAARLRDTELPRLREIPGHVGSQLLRSEHDGGVRFTVISQWLADAESAMGRITGELSSAGHATVARVLDGRPVDVVVGAAVSVDPVIAAPTNRRRDLVTVLAVGVVAAVLFAWLGRDDGEPTVPMDAVDLLSTTSGPVVAPIGAEGFTPWPDPPEDHDPHVIGRPGSGEPVRPDLVGQSLVYVNEQLRPTVIDLSTGDQRELDIAATRPSDRFLVEHGRVVVDDVLDPDLPVTAGHAFVFQVVVDGDADTTSAGPSPTLCLMRESGCAEWPWTTGWFGDDERSAQSIDGVDPSGSIARLIGSEVWMRDGRWTTFEHADGGPPLRVPTPVSRAVVWLVSEPV